MAENTLVVCGGTGAHVALALLRLHTLGSALGYFQRDDRALFAFPELFLVDQDAGDGTETGPTAWQLVRRLLEQHPGRWDWPRRMGREQPPVPTDVRPLPLGRNNDWYKPPFDTLAARFATSPLLPALTAKRQREVEYSKGMMGSPALGSLLFKLKEYDEKERGINSDERFGELLANEGRAVVAGSGVGGTGAAVVPTLARRLAENRRNSVMAVLMLSWFEFNENIADRELRERAAFKNRVLRQNAHSALEFCGQLLAKEVATVPVGMPDSALVRRDFTADFGQPICESFSLYVAALSALRHFTNKNAYRAGLYSMGDVERGRLDGKTSIPGGTLQDLVNRAATLVETLNTWQRMLSSQQTERIVPALYAEVENACDPGLVAERLREEIAHYGEQLGTVEKVLGLKAVTLPGLTFENSSRSRLRNDRRAPELGKEPSPEQAALALFHWTADWVREAAAPTNVLVVSPGAAGAGHWPDLKTPGIQPPIERSGDLNRVPDANISTVLEAFVDREYLSANGWPHPIAAADFFKHAIRQEDRVAWRQLELLLVGLASGLLVARPIPQRSTEEPISLEAIVKQYGREEHYEYLAQVGVYLPSETGDRLIAFGSPFTLLAPVPFLDDAADNALWQGLWERLTGADDGAPWATAARRERWREEQAVRVVRAWLARERKLHGEEAPVWAKLFEESQTGWENARFGAGPGIKVHWGDEEHLVEVSLPTGSLDDVDWVPPAGTPDWPEESLRAGVPELAVLTSADGRMRFSKTRFMMPDREEETSGFWLEHLQELQHQGKIFAFGQLPNEQVVIGTLVEGTLYQTRLSNCLILRRSLFAVQGVSPLVQEPVPGSVAPESQVLYPDLPLQPEFLDLAVTADGKPLLALADLRDTRWRPMVGRDASGRPTVTWSIPMRGRSTPVSIQLSLEGEANHNAHWMVWPRFRSTSPALWRTYYLYEFCTDARLVCDVLYLKGERLASDGRPRLKLHRKEEPVGPMEPLDFGPSAGIPAHSGGPPIALSVRNQRSGEARGLYLIRLEPLAPATADLKLAIDFGTSHSVAAYQAGDRREALEFPAELGPGAKGQPLSLHISEFRDHVVREKDGLLATGNWMPTYRSKSAGMIPSELLLDRPLERAKADDLSYWLPGRHYTIPPLDLTRQDLGDVVVSGFKWDANSPHFFGREGQLREHYLGFLLELVLAETVAHRLKAFPSDPVEVTFCYPLRCQANQVAALTKNFEQVLQRTSESTGIKVGLCKQVGLYDESRAAAVRRGTSCEVCLVADLGGGTLDLFLTGWDANQEPLKEVADSVRLGGGLLLREIARSANVYLPRNGAWNDRTEANLLAWVRNMGSPQLFGVDAGNRPAMSELGVYGFEKAAEGDPARKLLDRYFRLIAEFLARNLAAYLVGEWYPRVRRADYDDLTMTVQLRGNGWRLRYTPESDVGRAQAIQDLVRTRLIALWTSIPGNVYPLPEGDEHWLPAALFPEVNPKTAPVQGAVGAAMKYEDVKNKWYTHTLVDLEVLRVSAGTKKVPWISRIPFDSGGGKRIQLQDIEPAVPLDPAGADHRATIARLDAVLQGTVNQALQEDGRIAGQMYFAPVSAQVWEALFRSREFWPHLGE